MEAPDLTQFMDDKHFAYAVCAWLLWTQYRQLGLILSMLGRITERLPRRKAKDEE